MTIGICSSIHFGVELQVLAFPVKCVGSGEYHKNGTSFSNLFDLYSGYTVTPCYKRSESIYSLHIMNMKSGFFFMPFFLSLISVITKISLWQKRFVGPLSQGPWLPLMDLWCHFFSSLILAIKKISLRHIKFVGSLTSVILGFSCI